MAEPHPVDFAAIGHMSFTGLSATLATSTTKAKLTSFSASATSGFHFGPSEVVVPDASNDWITVSKAGVYEIDYSVLITGLPTAADAHEISVDVQVAPGNTTFTSVGGKSAFQGGVGDVATAAINTATFTAKVMKRLLAGDRVALFVLNENAGPENVIPVAGSLTVRLVTE